MIHWKLSEIHGFFFHVVYTLLKHFALELRKTIDILEEHFWKSCLLQIYSHLKETESTFSISFLTFFFPFLLSGKSGCFLISEVKLGLRDRSSPSRDADIGKEQEELGKLPLDLIRLRRVLLRCCKHQSSGKGVKKPPFLYWTPGRWQMNCSWSFDSKGDEKRKRGAITYRD